MSLHEITSNAFDLKNLDRQPGRELSIAEWHTKVRMRSDLFTLDVPNAARGVQLKFLFQEGGDHDENACAALAIEFQFLTEDVH
ncbi:MAG TPA: hypothetical protein VFJ82_21985 [Longimicrobium sp.]|nr:hypothetical protein [Longimicrobium sp.]